MTSISVTDMWLKLPVDVEEPEIEEAVEILKEQSKMVNHTYHFM